MANSEVKYLEYKGKPLVREGDVICYGDMSDKCILYMMIMSYLPVGDIEVPDKVLIQILSTDESLPAHERIIKQGEKNGLADALDIGIIWLERALNS